MKKILMTLAAAGVLAVPVGVIAAETDPTEPTEPTPTTVEPDRVQDQQRLAEDPGPAGDDTTEPVGNPECDCDGAQVRQRGQYRSEEGTGEGPMIRQREQNRFEDGTADGPMTRERQQNRLEDGTCDGSMIQDREQNRLEDGTADGPANGEPQQNQLEDGTGVGQAAPATDDGANLQFQYGQGSGRGNR